MKRNLLLTLAACTAGLFSAVPGLAVPLGPGFTYQGQLKQAGVPVDGTVNLSVRLYGAATGGSPIGSQPVNGVVVTDGLFSVELNSTGQLGPNAFNGDARWLEIAVNGQVLTPRQALTATPYALKVAGIDGHSLSAPDGSPSAAVSIDNDGNMSVNQIIRGQAQLILSSNTPDYKGAFIIANGAGPSAPPEQGWLLFQHGDFTAPAPDSSILFRYANNNQFSDQMVIRSNGNVGIGTLNPAQKLSVAGTVESTGGGFKFPDGTTQTTAQPSHWAVSGTNIYNTNTGLVGIGTNVPDRPLTIRGAGPADQWISFKNNSGATRWHVNHLNNGLNFAETAVADARLFLEPGGNVGVGTADPQAKLDVAGTTRTQILTITGGSDIAEPYNVCPPSVPGTVQAGMIVSIDASRVGELRLASNAYDTAVAGIISGAGGVNAGLTLTQEGSVADGKHPVAMTGRVWAWCDADAGGAIVAGDLLTTSDTPGHAMKALDRSRSGGATIGKAMSSLDSGKGLVLVLVNLQ